MDIFDIIIIGAGAGGLSAAACLSRAGKRVLVLEQDDHIGGTAHTFVKDGFTFPAGPISVTSRDYISGFLSNLGVADVPYYTRDHFQVKRKGMDVMVSVSFDNLYEQLSEIFPDEKKGIRMFFGIMEEVIMALDRMDPGCLDKNDPCPVYDYSSMEVIRRWGTVSARDIIDANIHDERLKDLLGSQGTGRTNMSVLLLARMWSFMSKKGIWYVRGGTGRIMELLAGKIRIAGGEIVTGTKVEGILVQDGKACGVELSEGRIIRSKSVISNADYKDTLLSLVPEDAVSSSERDAAARMPLTSSSFTIYLGIKRELADLSAFRGHHILVKLAEGDPVPWKVKKPAVEEFLRDEIWISWWSKHDPSFAPPGCEALIIKVMAPFDRFAHFQGEGHGHHLEKYYLLKEQFADAIIEVSEKVIAGLREAIIAKEIATPLTYSCLGHRNDGAVAGWSWKFEDHPEPWIHNFTRTPVPGLFTAGIQSFTHLFYGGMGTSIYSGEYAAKIILKNNE